MFAAGRVPGATLAGVVDIDLARAEAAASGAPAFSDIEQALRDLKPDAAYVATPDALHRGPVEACASAGVPLLVEKPLATTVEDGRAMVAAVKAAGIHAEVNYSNRWNPPYARAKKLIERGEIGDVRSFNARLNNPISSPRDRLGWSGTTTSAWFLMSHCLDLAVWLGGKRALSVYATGSKGILAAAGKDTYDWVHASVRFETGADGFFEAAWILPESWPGGVEFNYRVLGSIGLIDLDTTNQNITLAGKRHEYPPTLSWAAERLASFLDALDGRPGTTVPFEEAQHVTEILVAVHRSLETGVVEQIRA